MAQATVINPQTGHRKVVTVGDPNAFAGGYVLETAANRPQANAAPQMLGSPGGFQFPSFQGFLGQQGSGNKMAELEERLRQAQELQQGLIGQKD